MQPAMPLHQLRTVALAPVPSTVQAVEEEEPTAAACLTGQGGMPACIRACNTYVGNKAQLQGYVVGTRQTAVAHGAYQHVGIT